MIAGKRPEKAAFPICRDLLADVDQTCIVSENPLKIHYPLEEKYEPEVLPAPWNLKTRRRKS